MLTRALPLTFLMGLVCAATRTGATTTVTTSSIPARPGPIPNPGCSGPADTTENSVVALPAGCTVELTVFNGDDLFPGIAVHGCGAIKAAWFKPSAEPADCFYAVGDGAVQTCSVSGATFAPTTDEVLLAMHTASLPQCGPVTTAITLGNGTVAARRDDWC